MTAILKRNIGNLTEEEINNSVGEYLAIRQLITNTYPRGIVSIVADSFDFWDVVINILPSLKEVIEARDGKVVIRPDSGDPVKIITGYTHDEVRVLGDGSYRSLDDDSILTEAEFKGLIQCLWETFGGTESSTGYRVLSDKIGAIYGDSITIDRAKQICLRLKNNGFASTNLVYGIGSFSYQGAITPDAIVTRDTYGFAVKATWTQWNGKGIDIYKDPKTDDGSKKSAKGRTAVFKGEDGEYFLMDQASHDELYDCEYDVVFSDGELLRDMTLAEIRDNVKLS